MSRTKSLVLSGCFLVASLVFVWRSFYGMRITTAKDDVAPRRGAERDRRRNAPQARCAIWSGRTPARGSG